ncbi:hydrogen peroxide-inducible genes activator [Porphyromonas circumdentaria]|uniref:LysR family transcriptional regulator, hydrogen peroxide-inducible genes activator n=1 Tax=Porphyromonas circumdentaria TaxID=29524 RepID=A0A1T4PMI0_9PORP|nr:hydrogen peroxide-inducible genes activator [Porphyromonas circumdentaria]MBB6276423.1 LysR family hydrogen peroxide-inducible transcriptional activator [Porphyromonas circumdentaria]MDO4722553.1 LysR substrate-binding domain-containing protein [Porphyromonas circumdentaria]SJZ92118.1 LysR family transcriptional regulator, hydrogen peroxide-inducible genes activator [Porphyromonas circumdentaria]
MTLQQLEYLLALDKHRQFAKAATACDITQPTLSTMIQRLEEELGVTLFDRTQQRPTEIGLKVIEQARCILQEASQIKSIIDEEKNTIQGTFTLAVLPTIAPYLLPLVLPRWRTCFKDLELRIVEMKTSDCLRSITDRTVDMAIIASDPEQSDIRYSQLYYEEFLGYVSRNEKIYSSSVVRTSEVDPQRMWLLDEGHCFRDQLVRFCQLKYQNKSKLTYSEGNLISFMHIVEAGQGLTFIPKLAERYLDTNQRTLVRPFAIPRPVRGIYLAYRKDFVRQSVLTLFEESIRSSVPREMLTIGPEQVLAK